MASCEEDVVRHLGRTARKRARVPSEWAKNKEKLRKYASDGSIPKVACNHNDGFCKASELSTADCKRFHSLFYNNTTKVEQDAFITNCIQVQKIQRIRGKQNERKQEFSISYFIQRQDGDNLKVCSASFCSILRVNYKRVQRLAAYYFKNCSSRGETRGGKRINIRTDGIKDLIGQHIMSFKCCSAHYGREKVS